MRTSFQTLAERFSHLRAEDNTAFITFYHENKKEIADLKDFETDEELYLSAVINHTYGRSQLYENNNYDTAEKHLDIARTLILTHKDQFEIELKEDVWYSQTLQHLLKISLHRKKYGKAKELLNELVTLDKENSNRYQLKRREINRIRKQKFYARLAYGGTGLLAISVAYRFLYGTAFGPIGSIGTIISLIGLAGAYLCKDRVKRNGG